jgi:hypothetical protein
MHLLKKYNAHINVEWCNKSNMIKYLFKYITKESDRARVYFEVTAKTSNPSPGPQLAPRDEIQEYIDADSSLHVKPYGILSNLTFTLECLQWSD